MTNILKRLAERLSPGDPSPHYEATERTAEQVRHLHAQQPEAARFSLIARVAMQENHLAEKIRLALREG